MSREDNRKLLYKTEAVVIILVIVICVGLMIYFRELNQEATSVTIFKDGTKVKTINIDESISPYIIDIDSDPVSHIEISSLGARFINAECPDKLCEKTGMINALNPVAVCLPNRVMIKAIGPTDIDAIA